MSTDDGNDGGNGSGGSDGGPGRREVAHRVFAAEFDDATVSYRESDEERAPNYVVTPTGARVNRLFAAGVLTEVEAVNDDVVRARIADPTGAFVSYAGQYQPDPLAFFERTDPPSFVALTGKARTFEPDDGDRIYTSVRPESVNAVDADTRDRWVVSAAEATLDRVALFEEALGMEERGGDLRDRLRAAGYREPLAAGVPLAIERYGTTPAYLEAVRRTAVEALELVAGERDAVDGIDLAPGEGGPTSVGPTPTDAQGTSAAAADTGTADESSDGSVGADASDVEGTGTAPDADETEAAPDVEETEAAPDVEETEATPDVEETEATPDAENATGTVAAEAGTDPADAPAGADAGTDAEGSDTVESADDGEADTDEAGGGAATTADASGAGLEDFDAGPVGDSGAEANDADTADAGDAADEDEMYELDEAERREVEEEFGTEFSTGSEVDDPGEADIDVPGPEGGVEPTGDAEAAADASDDGESDGPADVDRAVDAEDEAPAVETEEETAAAETDDAGVAVDLADAAVAAMEDLDDGDGADREAVVAAVVDDHGADPGAVEDAIQDALMSGRCYEPTEGSLKSI